MSEPNKIQKLLVSVEYTDDEIFFPSIFSGLLAAANKVRVASASLLIIGSPLSDINKLFLSKNSGKHATAIRLLPSTKTMILDKLE